MRVHIHNQDLLDLPTEALVVAVDGAAPGLEGNIARQLRARIGDESWADVEAQLVYPFPARAVQVAEVAHPSVAFRFLLVLGVLSHEAGIDHRFLLGRALHSAFGTAERMRYQSIACPVLSGGWRIKPLDALYAILAAARSFEGPELHLATLDKDLLDAARTVLGT